MSPEDLEASIRYLDEEQRFLTEWITRGMDPERFRFRPWAEPPLATFADLVDRITKSIRETGEWETYGEMAMAGGPTVRLEPAEVGGYRVSAEYGITVSGAYGSLPEALAAGSLFASVVWEVMRHGGVEGFVWPDGE
jgi:hypothetical protein